MGTLDKTTVLPEAGIKPNWREELLAAMTAGVPLRTACLADGMPSHDTVYREAAKNSAFAEQLSRARIDLASAQQDRLDEDMEEARAISDPISGGVRVQALKLASDILKFKLVKVLPKLYGDRPQTEVNVHNTIGIVCDEKQRALLIAQREELLLGDRPEQKQLHEQA